MDDNWLARWFRDEAPVIRTGLDADRWLRRKADEIPVKLTKHKTGDWTIRAMDGITILSHASPDETVAWVDARRPKQEAHQAATRPQEAPYVPHGPSVPLGKPLAVLSADAKKCPNCQTGDKLWTRKDGSKLCGLCVHVAGTCNHMGSHYL